MLTHDIVNTVEWWNGVTGRMNSVWSHGSFESMFYSKRRDPGTMIELTGRTAKYGFQVGSSVDCRELVGQDSSYEDPGQPDEQRTDRGTNYMEHEGPLGRRKQQVSNRWFELLWIGFMTGAWLCGMYMVVLLMRAAASEYCCCYCWMLAVLPWKLIRLPGLLLIVVCCCCMPATSEVTCVHNHHERVAYALHNGYLEHVMMVSATGQNSHGVVIGNGRDRLENCNQQRRIHVGTSASHVYGCCNMGLWHHQQTSETRCICNRYGQVLTVYNEWHIGESATGQEYDGLLTGQVRDRLEHSNQQEHTCVCTHASHAHSCHDIGQWDRQRTNEAGCIRICDVQARIVYGVCVCVCACVCVCVCW